MDILEKLEGLYKQATPEPSHYYVALYCQEAIEEIKALRQFNPFRQAVDELAEMIVHICRNAKQYDGTGLETPSSLVQQALAKAVLRQGKTT